MVEVARLARLANRTSSQTLDKILQLKIFNTSFTKFHDKCIIGQLDKESQKEVFSYIDSNFNNDNQSISNYDIEYEDMKTGVMIFYTIALYQIRLMISTNFAN